VTEGDAYLFLLLVLLAPAAGLALLLNSLYCLYRYRSRGSVLVTLAFVVVSGLGALAAWYFLPQFRM
jgi:hypothetical protein